ALHVDSSPRSDAAGIPTEKESGRPYRKIFASYSHRDMDVVQHVGAFARVYGVDFIRDKSHLRVGEEWNPQLQQLIREADVFELFWSSNSMTSPEVNREWAYALSLNRPAFVFPVYWQDPFPEDPGQDLPPPQLRSLHFERLALEQLPMDFRLAAPAPPDVPSSVRPAPAYAAKPPVVTGPPGSAPSPYAPPLPYAPPPPSYAPPSPESWSPPAGGERP